MYYIDFDNTLYETGKLTKDVIYNLSKLIAESKNISIEAVLEDITSSFNSATDNFFTLAKKMSIKYGVSYNILYNKITELIITNGKNYVFPDAIKFLEKLKKLGETTTILTYVDNSKNLSQQALKLTGSGILDYVSEVYTTTRYKFELEIDYENNTFIDDNPRDLEGLYKSGAKKIIRMKKPSNQKRNSKTLNIPEEIPTYESFDMIEIPEKNENFKTIN